MPGTSGGGRLRVLFHSQHLSGVGHHVRTREIARTVAASHDVWMVDGGRPVPRPAAAGVRLLPVPRIVRRDDGLAPLNPEQDLAAVLRRRSAELEARMPDIRPDVLVVEHYPFSKWELEDEFLGLIRASRRANPAVRVIGSIRDVIPQPRSEAHQPDVYASRVIHRLESHFDALMVHGDPALTRLDEHFPRAADIGVPVQYTGIVCETDFRPHPFHHGNVPTPSLARAAPTVLASVGGGEDPLDLLGTCVDAWRLLEELQALPGWRLLVFTGLDWSAHRREELQRRAASTSIVLKPFGDDFLPCLRTARVSVSCAGYNTCANLLDVRCPAVLVPNRQMSDQEFRAARLAALGLAQAIMPDELDAPALAAAIVQAARSAPFDHSVAIDGAGRSADYIERLAASSAPTMADDASLFAADSL